VEKAIVTNLSVVYIKYCLEVSNNRVSGLQMLKFADDQVASNSAFKQYRAD